MKLSITALLFIGLASPLAASPTLNVRQTGPTHKVTVFLLPVCFETKVPLLPNQYKELNVKYNKCYDAIDTGITGSKFMSAMGAALAGAPQPPAADNVICETKVYFLDNCAGDVASTDNYSGNCVNAVLSPSNDITQTIGKSFRVECCKGAADGKSCLYVQK